MAQNKVRGGCACAAHDDTHHGKEVLEARDERGLFGELLTERIAQIVRGVRGDDEHAAAHCGELHGERARARGLPNTSLACTEE